MAVPNPLILAGEQFIQDYLIAFMKAIRPKGESKISLIDEVAFLDESSRLCLVMPSRED